MQRDLGVAGEPCVDRRVFVGLVVVEDQVQLSAWVAAGEESEEGEELVVSVARVAGVGDPAGRRATEQAVMVPASPRSAA